MAFILCLIGVSGSGKTTLASALKEKLNQHQVRNQVIDGDILRDDLGNLFGYTYEERMKQNKVVQVLAKYLVLNDINCIISIVAPYETMRKNMRQNLGQNYIQCYLDCDVSVCAKRDVKGYYKKAKENLMENLNGVNEDYEKPLNSELVINTDKYTVEESVDIILGYLMEKNFIIPNKS